MCTTKTDGQDNKKQGLGDLQKLSLKNTKSLLIKIHNLRSKKVDKGVICQDLCKGHDKMSSLQTTLYHS